MPVWLIISDTHGVAGGLPALVERHRPDALFHLGDHERDTLSVRLNFPDLPLFTVPGNCDFVSQNPPVRLETVDGVPVYLTHGHLHGVKRELSRLTDAARASGAKLCLFGHTHTALCRTEAGLTLFNPGSPSHPRLGGPSYGLIETSRGSLSPVIIPYAKE